MPATLGSVAPVGFADFADPRWLGCMRRLGCRSVQVYRNRNGDGGRAEPVTTKQMLEYVAAGQMPCDSLHGLYGNDLDPSSPDEAARRAAVDAFKAEGDLALELGGPLVVVHCSGIVGPDESAPSRQDLAVRRERLRTSIEELGAFGERRGVRYAFENLPPYHFIGSDVGDLARLLAEIGSPAVGMCFDVAHANLAGDCLQAADAAAPHTIYVHLCDNHGRTDDHLAPFVGNIDWPAFARRLHRGGYNGTLMLEIFPQLDELERMVDEGLGRRLAEFLAAVNPKS